MDVGVPPLRDCAPLPGHAAGIVVVDDHPMIRSGLRASLSAEPDLVVRGEACDGLAGSDLVLRERPDLVLMDVAMPLLDGIGATRRIVAAWPQARVVMLTAFADGHLVRAALAAGACGYLLKDADPRSVVCAVRRALRGSPPLPAGLVHGPPPAASGPRPA